MSLTNATRRERKQQEKRQSSEMVVNHGKMITDDEGQGNSRALVHLGVIL